MLAEGRRHAILERIASRGFVTLAELVETLGISESTARRDLEMLERQGEVRRTHGGAVAADAERSLPAFDDRTATLAREKRAIGRAAADLIEDGESVLIDGGTTTYEVARALAGRPVQILTNSLPIAQLITAAPGRASDLILIGGFVYPRTGVALGPQAIAQMNALKVDRAVLGAGGVTSEGVYNSNLLLVETERAMMACAAEVVIVADHSKLNKTALSWLCGLDRISQLVTDSGASESARAFLEAAGTRVIIAPASSHTNPTEPGPNGRRRLDPLSRSVAP
ncbi:transcriptional regulator, DeoR family [Isosphaera pallida ATCC 43644]|jgi:DeoR/GlpR family transcriptional regulator of sugar metabolism|uniref:Transcriptional regulator, DeoR family n=1 Tax=Isosphaera pallida (strain ATCC 43644 / DSM 9630 / IS1B) TaxID=575540 RepID=E8R080_ISOPI|nr:DeoR/GlpR family DNA-binding transcription regulator [Isosphaera pallida]ADV62207.1 transcriptional regulator, DeoR family [Isosphaera pallida ATCC 43644]